jgi:hypothetical protein
MVLDRIRKLHNTMACSGGVISNLRSPSGGRTGEREVEVEEAGAPGREEEARGQWLVFSSSLGPPFI